MNTGAKVLAGLAVAAVIAAGAFVLIDRDSNDSSSTTTTAATGTQSREFVGVERRDLRDTKDFDAEVSYGEEWTLPFTISGTVTARHERGTVVAPGQPVIWIDTRPVFFAEGEVPLYRDLYRGTIKRPGMKSEPVSGDDVSQLQRFLLAQGHDDDGKLEDDGVFGKETERAVKAWQKANDLDQTGRITSTQLIFSPGSVRIQSEQRVGDKFDALQVTSPNQEIVIRTGRRDAKYLKKAAEVEIKLGPDTVVTGEVTKADEVHDKDTGQTVLKVTIVAGEALPADLTSVTIVGKGVAVENALTVPVRALVALAEGGYAVDVQTSGASTELRSVDVGEILEGFAVITGDIAEGDKVVVPT